MFLVNTLLVYVSVLENIWKNYNYLKFQPILNFVPFFFLNVFILARYIALSKSISTTKRLKAN